MYWQKRKLPCDKSHTPQTAHNRTGHWPGGWLVEKIYFQWKYEYFIGISRSGVGSVCIFGPVCGIVLESPLKLNFDVFAGSSHGCDAILYTCIYTYTHIYFYYHNPFPSHWLSVMLCCVCVRQMYRLERVAFSFLLETFAFQLKNHKIALASMKRLIYIKPTRKTNAKRCVYKMERNETWQNGRRYNHIVCAAYTHTIKEKSK